MRQLISIVALCAAVQLIPLTAHGQTQVTVTGQFFGELRCDDRPRAELITLGEINDIPVARVRTYPVEGGAYFQWHDALYELEAGESGTLVSIRGAYIRGIEGDNSPPVDLLLDTTNKDMLMRLDAGAVCGGPLRTVEPEPLGAASFPDILQGSVSHLTQNMRSFERIADSTNPNAFPTEILSVVDDFGAVMTLRVDSDERLCLYRTTPVGELQVQRTLLYGVGACSEAIVGFSERGPVLMLDWGGGYRNGAGRLESQDRRVAAFMTSIGAEPDTPPAGAAAGMASIPGAIIPTVDRPADYPPAFAGMDWDIRGVPLGSDIQSTMAIAAPGQRLDTENWTFETGTVFDREERRPQYGPQRIQLNNRSYQGGVDDYVILEPTNWHQGQMVHTVFREVQTNDLERMPTVNALLEAIYDRYGRPISTSRFTYGAGGIGQQSFQRMIFPIRDGEVRNVPCVPMDRGIRNIGSVGRSNSMGRVTSADVPELEQALQDIVERGCEAVFVIEYSVAAQNRERVRAYRFMAVDVRLRLADALSEIATRAEMRAAAMDALPEVAPDL
jgi:hypothetical protein